MAFEGRVFGGAYSIPVDPSLVNPGITYSNTVALIPTLDLVPSSDNSLDVGKTNQRWKNICGVSIIGTDAYVTSAEVVNIKARTNTNTLFTMLRSIYDATYGNVTELRNSAGVNYIQCTENSNNRIVGNVLLFGALSMQSTNSIFFPSYQLLQNSTTGLTIGAYTGTNKIVFSNNSSGTVAVTAAGGFSVTGQASVSGLVVCAGLLPQNDLTWDAGSNSQRWGNLYCAGINATGTVIPNLTTTYDLGSTSKRWNNIYAILLDLSTVNATNVNATNSTITTANITTVNAGTINTTAGTINAGLLNIGTGAGWHFNEISTTLYMTNTGGVGVNISSGSTAWAAVSDRRSKKNITYLPETGTLTRMLSLKTCYFKYLNDDDTSYQRVGLIGQEVEQVFPDVVNTEPAQAGEVGLKSIRYTDLIPYLIKSIQELSARVDVLTAELELVKKKPK